MVAGRRRSGVDLLFGSTDADRGRVEGRLGVDGGGGAFSDAIKARRVAYSFRTSLRPTQRHLKVRREKEKERRRKRGIMSD